MRLLITGASGLLGVNLSLVAARQGHAVTGLAHSRMLHGVPFEVQAVDLLDPEQSKVVIEKAQPDALIHCAAVADVNTAEMKPDLAQKLNAEVPGLLAAEAARQNIPFMHISTDAVFNGRRGDYKEDDPPDPLSVYARTKLAGEKAVQAVNSAALVIRTVFYGWSLSGRRSLAEFFVNRLKAGEHLQGFADTYFCPLYVEDLAELLLGMFSKRLSGTFHLVSSEGISKYDFGVRIACRFGYDPALITPVNARELDRGARRSLNLTLNSDKAANALGHPLPTIDDGLERFYQRWQEGYPERLQGCSQSISSDEI